MDGKKENEKTEKLFLQVLKGEQQERIPFWFMRQAGRYLPEYRELRKEAGSFLDMAYNPQMASEITMQPIRRFEMDAAIIFSDILVIPHALGQHLEFVTGVGPKLDPIHDADDFKKFKPELIHATLEKVYQALEETRSKLNAEGFGQTSLIGFAGAPWTVACYMIEGGGSKDFQKARLWAYQNPESFTQLIDILVDASADYLIHQIKHGAEALQIFDSWAGALEANQFHKWVIHPTKRIVDKIKSEYPHTPIIGFPRGSGLLYRDYVRDTGVTAISTDYGLSTSWIASALQPMVPVQGNLDPVSLLSGGDALKLSAEKILNDLSGGPFIFNLGHGVIKETPIDHVQQMIRIIRDFKG